MRVARLRAAALAMTLCLMGATGATQAAPPPADVFFKDPDIDQAVLSPSGRLLAITSSKGLGRTGLAIIDLAPGNKITRIADFTSGDIYDVRWVNEDRLIFSAADNANLPRWLRAPPVLYGIDRDGGNVRKLWLGYHHVLRIPTPVAGQANDQILMAQYTDWDGESKPVWLNTRIGRIREPDQLNAPPHVVSWLADSRGELRVALTRLKDRLEAYWRAPGSTKWTKLYESGLLNAPFEVEGVDDAGSLYVTRRKNPEGYQWLSRYDFQAGKPEDKFIAETPGFDFQGSLLTESGGGKALGVRLVVDGETTVWFDPQMKGLQAQADRLFPNKVNRINCRRCGEPDMVAVVRSFSDHDPGRLYLYQAKPPEGEKTWRPIGPVRDDVKPEQMASMDLHRIKARDGRDLPVWVTRPDVAPGPLPAVVLVHGGPWMRGSAWGWHGTSQFLASRGYVVIEPEMRGSTGYGQVHFEAGFKQWGQAMQNDVADALRWAQGQGLASGKACIVGGSYGGYSTLMGLVNDPELFRCGIAGFAPTDLELLVEGSWWVPDDIHDLFRQYGMRQLVGDAKNDATMLQAQSPLKQAARIKAPVMLVYGEKDKRVPLAHGERMRDALRKAGNDPVWVTYPDEGHGLYEPKSRVDYAQRVEAFLAKHLGPATPP